MAAINLYGSRGIRHTTISPSKQAIQADKQRKEGAGTKVVAFDDGKSLQQIDKQKQPPQDAAPISTDFISRPLREDKGIALERLMQASRKHTSIKFVERKTSSNYVDASDSEVPKDF